MSIPSGTDLLNAYNQKLTHLRETQASLPSGVDLNHECTCPFYLEDGLKHAEKATKVTQKQAEIILARLIEALRVDPDLLSDLLHDEEEFEDWGYDELEQTLSAMDLRFDEDGPRGNFIGYLTHE